MHAVLSVSMLKNSEVPCAISAMLVALAHSSDLSVIQANLMPSQISYGFTIECHLCNGLSEIILNYSLMVLGQVPCVAKPLEHHGLPNSPSAHVPM